MDVAGVVFALGPHAEGATQRHEGVALAGFVCFDLEGFYVVAPVALSMGELYQRYR